ncbi:MAG: TIGR00730 family Rossman fold protein [Candidatus Eisenbacteria bacterium]|nr:TIGR00730 family Rossman fold protein [Candidatus Eisenbacteria bacterium]
MKRICVYAASNPGRDRRFGEAAARLGRVVASRGLEMVYGGGRLGVMGRAADGAIAAGGRVTGVIPRFMEARVHPGLTRVEYVETMHERKARMAALADGFVTLPGGLGTLEETVEILTWTQLGLHRKPLGLLNAAGYYDPLLAWMDRAAREGFLRPEHRAMVLVAGEPEDLLGLMADYRAPASILDDGAAGGPPGAA